MAKRFTDTSKYKRPFMRSLQGAYKLLWDYLYHDCDHAGIWIVDFDVAQLYIGNDMPVNKEEAIKLFNNGENRIISFDKDTKWFIPSFIDFQYGELKENNRAHASVIGILKKYKLLGNKGLIRSLQGRKDKDKDKDKDKEKDKHLETVLLSANEYNNLCKPWGKDKKQYTEHQRELAIEYLDNYLRSSGKKYESHYAVLQGWVYDEIQTKHPTESEEAILFYDPELHGGKNAE